MEKRTQIEKHEEATPVLQVFDSDSNLCTEFNFDLKITYPCFQQHAALRLVAASGISKKETLIKKHLCAVFPLMIIFSGSQKN